ncbi:ADP-ribosylarginine hydrolase Tri1-like [Saccostrea cucullata]|uniref:ADP-ribosylarginine hydrolase Tri1-like n=1 Tax=Saccostrea cuccullata TaxID=36930 RepID=UPI002ED430EA
MATPTRRPRNLNSSLTPRKYHPYSKQIRKGVNETFDRVYACVYGHCVGDAIGLLTETFSKTEAKKRYREVYKSLELIHKKIVPDAHRRKWLIGEWTDESDMMILILQTIVMNKGEVNAHYFARCLMEWAEKGFPELDDICGNGLCPQIKAVISHPQFSEEPEKASEIMWRDSGKLNATNSALSRTAILGTLQYHTIGTVIKNTLDICNITHPDPRCRASCVALTTTIALLLQRNDRQIKKSGSYDIEAVVDESFTYASKLLVTYEEVKELKRAMHPSNLKDLRLDEPGKTNYTYKTLGAGFWALRQKNFREAIQDIVLEGGDSDANAAVGGALLGCKLGLSAIPRSWRENLIHREWLDILLDRYFDIHEGRHIKKETTL